jgi:hypothetical protein
MIPRCARRPNTTQCRARGSAGGACRLKKEQPLVAPRHTTREQALDAESQPAQDHRANEEGANSTLSRPCLFRHQMMRRSQDNL